MNADLLDRRVLRPEVQIMQNERCKGNHGSQSEHNKP